MACLDNNPSSGEPERSGVSEYETLVQRSQELNLQARQLVTLAYGFALDKHNTESRPWIQRYATEAGGPTTAFRMDSLYPYLLENGRMEPEHMYVHVPAGWNPEEFVPSYKAKKIEHRNGGRIVRIAVDEELGFRSKEEAPETTGSFDANPLTEASLGDTKDLDIETMLRQATAESQVVVRMLAAHVRELQHDFKVVDFRSGLNL